MEGLSGAWGLGRLLTVGLGVGFWAWGVCLFKLPECHPPGLDCLQLASPGVISVFPVRSLRPLWARASPSRGTATEEEKCTWAGMREGRQARREGGGPHLVWGRWASNEVD